MARVTVEDCLKRVDNRFGLIHLAAKRVRQLRKGNEPLVVCKNKDIVVALREIAAGAVYQVKNGEDTNLITNTGDSDPAVLPEQTGEASPSPEPEDLEAKVEGK